MIFHGENWIFCKSSSKQSINSKINYLTTPNSKSFECGKSLKKWDYDQLLIHFVVHRIWICHRNSDSEFLGDIRVSRLKFFKIQTNLWIFNKGYDMSLSHFTRRGFRNFIKNHRKSEFRLFLIKDLTEST